MQTSLLHSLLFLGLAGGCVASGQAGYTANATVTAPEMVVISPGVQVVANYDEPVFYSDNYYWRYDNGFWMRSHSHSGGFVRYTAPRAILSIERPSAYVRYRGSASVNTRSHDETADERKERNDKNKKYDRKHD